MKIDSEYLKEVLEQKGVSPEKLGEKLGMSGEGIRKIIKEGKTKEATIKKIAKTIDLDLQRFCPDMVTGLSAFEFATKEKGMLERISQLENTVKQLNDSILDIYKRLPN